MLAAGIGICLLGVFVSRGTLLELHRTVVAVAARRGGLQSKVELWGVVSGEGLAHHVGEKRAHHAARHAEASGQLGVSLAQRPLETLLWAFRGI